VPLTGDGLYAGACRGRKNCTATLPTPLAELLEGGSFTVGLVSEADGVS
jgi:hypothetical protein